MKRKEKFALFSFHSGSLFRRQARATIIVQGKVLDLWWIRPILSGTVCLFPL